MLAALFMGAIITWCRSDASFASSSAPISFRDAAPRSGIQFTLENSPTSRKHLVETMAGGVAVLDYDNDGLPDIFVANGASVPSLQKNNPKYRNRLFHNLGNWKFQDVTTSAGLAGSGFSIGASAADYDNDGWTDLFVAGVHSNHLYRNLGNGTFEEVTARAQISSDAWSIVGGWFDFDNDGWLDLFVVNYVKWSAGDAPSCSEPITGLTAYCHPRFFAGTTNVLYKNLGDGTFRDVSTDTGVARYIGKGMSVAFADFDGDGRMDVFVPNDKMPNILLRNQDGRKFEEIALEAGVALLDNGKEVSGMGVAFRDYDNDRYPDILVAALAGETYPLFRNTGKSAFIDWTSQSQLAVLTNEHSGWSPLIADFNNDGLRDIFVANSHVNDTVEQFESAQYKLPNSIFLAHRDGTFSDVSKQAGQDFQVPRAHRGAALADFNADGKLDVVTTSLQAPMELWENMSSSGNWICLDLEGKRSNRNAIGARIAMGDSFDTVSVNAGYASSSNSCTHFGLGARTVVNQIEIIWPSGTRQTLFDVKANQKLRIREP